MKISIELWNQSIGQSGIPHFISDIKDIYLPIAISILTVIGLIRGLQYISSLKEKQKTAVFGFWSQLVIRLKRIKDELTVHPELINNIYEPTIREGYETGTANTKDINEFKKVIEELETFLKATPDQMPAYSGWSEDLHTLMDFISCVCTYDICDKDHLFVDNKFFKNRNEYCKYTIDAISNIMQNIEKEQTFIENKLNRKSLSFYIYEHKNKRRENKTMN